MTPGAWTAGWTWAAIGIVSLAVMGRATACKLFRQPRGWPLWLGTAIVAWTWLTVGTQFLGAIGHLFRSTLLAWSVGGAALAVLLPARKPEPDPAACEQNPSDWNWAATISLGALLGGCVQYGTLPLILPPRIVSDGPIYHLYFAARWWKEGRLFLIHFPFGESAATYFPAGGDLVLTWLMAVFGGDRLARVGQAPFFALAVLAVFATARQLRSRRPAAVVAAVWFATSYPLFFYVFEANVDDFLLAGYLLACYFGLRYWLDGNPGTLALAGLAAGGAWGSKPTATLFILPLLAIAALVVLCRSGTTARQRARDLLVLLTTPLVMAGFWYARNAILTGNPLYPLRVAVWGQTILPGWYNLGAMRRSQWYVPVTHWRAFLDMLLRVLDVRLAPVWLAALAGAWAIGKKRDPLDRWVWSFAVLAVFNYLLYWLVIPYRTQQRFALHALGLAAVPLAMLLDRSGWLCGLGSALVLVHMAADEGWPICDLDRTPIWRLSHLFPRGAIAILTIPWGIVFAVAGVIVVRLLVRASRRKTLSNRALALAASIALMLAGLPIIWWESATSGRAEAARSVFPTYEQYQAGWLALDRLCPPAGARIAYAGTNLPYFLMGAGLRNEVRYVNIDAHPDWMMHDYHRTASGRGEPEVWNDPSPGWDRLRPDYDAWLANLRAEGIEFLVVTRADPIAGPFNIIDATGFPTEGKWASDHPDVFLPVYGVMPADPQFRIYRLFPTRR
jgi:hypothetical protein